MRPRIRVEQQLIGVEAMTRLRLVGSIDAKAVKCPRADIRDPSMKNLVGEFRQFEALDLAFAVAVENADFHPRRMR